MLEQPSLELVEAHLAKVLEVCKLSATQQRFLEHVVKAALDGQTEISGLSIAIELFGRHSSDLRADNPVKTAKRGVQRRLEHFYAKEGSAESVRIVFSEGQYVPELVDTGLNDVTAPLKRIECGVANRARIDRPIAYASVPPLPAWYIARPEALDSLRELVLNSSGPVGLTALQGMGGVGKTILAMALCHDDRIRLAFPDGIVWLDFGRESRLSLLEHVRKVARTVEDDTSKYTAENCDEHYRKMLKTNAVLVVADDIWSVKDVEPLIADSARSRLLFTTRDTSIAGGVGAQNFTAEILSRTDSREFLVRWSRRQGQDLPAVADGIVEECSGLCLALAMIGASLRDRPDEDWADKLDDLRNARLSEIGGDLAHYKFKTLHAAIKVSVEALDEIVRQHYQKLAVLLEDVAASASVLQVLWNLDERRTRNVLRQLEDRSLARREHGGIRVHDLQLDYLRGQHGHSGALSIMQQALRLSPKTVWADGAAFASQVVGRISFRRNETPVQGFIEETLRGAPKPWLRPLSSGLVPPGGILLRTLIGHSAPVTGVSNDATGRITVSASADKTLKVWDVQRGYELSTLIGHTAEVAGVALSADAGLAVSASLDGTLKVWDVAGGRSLRTLSGHSGGVSGVALTPDGRIAVSASLDQTVKIWDVANGRNLQTLVGHVRRVSGVAVDAGGRAAVSTSEDGTVKVWTLRGWQKGNYREIATGAPASSVAVSADGRVVVTASFDNALTVWDVKAKRRIRTLEGHEGWVTSASLSSDGTKAISASFDGSVIVWDIASGRKLLCLLDRHTSEIVTSVAMRADGTLAVSTSWKELTVWDLTKGVRLCSFTSDAPLGCCAVAKQSVAAGDRDGRVHLFALEQ